MKNLNLIPSLVSKLTGKFISLAIISFLIVSPLFVSAGSELRELSSFHKIDFSGPFNVKLVQGEKEQVLVEGDDELIAKVITKVDNGELEIFYKEKMSGPSSITLTITFKNLDAIDSYGALDISGAATINVSTISLNTNGAAKLDLDITAEKISLEIAGAGSSTLTGKAQSVVLNMSGAGSLMATSLIADEYEIELSGAGNAKVNAISKINVEISGAGSLYYAGEPKITKEITGAGTVNKM